MSNGPPTHLGEYRLLEPLGAGGMGEVFLAERVGAAGVTRKVVVKRIKGVRAEDHLARERFMNEARIAMRLDHGNIVQVFDFGRDDEGDGQLHLVMEWVDGPSLFGLWRTARRQGERIPFPLSAFILRSLLAGLHFAHEQVDEDGQPLGIVHRDVSPQNVLLDLEGQVKLTDFGIARARDVVSRTRPGIVRGKLVYFSPEQLTHGAVDRRTDVFAAGVVLYQLLTGALPVLGEVETVRRLLLEGGWARASMVEPALPPQLEEVLEEAMAIEVDGRFPTAAAFGQALDRWLLTVAPGTGEADLADYLAWVYRETPEGRAAASHLSASYAVAMRAWERERPASASDQREGLPTAPSGTTALPLPGVRPSSASPLQRRIVPGALALLLGLASLAGWWIGKEPAATPAPSAPSAPTVRTLPPGPPAPEPLGPKQPPSPPPTPTPTPNEAAPPALEDESGSLILRESGNHSLLPEGGARTILLSALALSPEEIPWALLPLARRGTTRLEVSGEASLGGMVPRRLHTVLAFHEGRRGTGLHLIRPGQALSLRGPGKVKLAICDPMGFHDNLGHLRVQALQGKRRLRGRTVDPRTNAFRADQDGGVNFVGLLPTERYRLEFEAPPGAPPLLWVHPLQVGAAITRQGDVDSSIGLLRPGQSASFFGTRELFLLAIPRAEESTATEVRYRVSVRQVSAAEPHPE